MSQATLRKLARDYAYGTLAKEDYRKSRAELLEGILSGKIELKVNKYLPPIVSTPDDVLDITTDKPPKNENSDITQFGDASAPQPPAVEATSTPATVNSNNQQKLIIAGTVIGLVFVVALVIAFLPDSKESTTKTAATKSTTGPQQIQTTNTAPGKAQTLIQEFLEKKDWSATSLNRFRIQWQSLTEEQQAAATGTVQLGQLTNSIYKKLLEERALSGLGDDEAVLNKQRLLVEFAENIGINDSRIRLPRGISP